MSQTGQIRIALAQINPTVGDLSKNSDLISKYAFDAANAGAVVVVYPEMVLTGYPVEDLANRPSFRAASITAVGALATRINNEGNGDLTLLVGYLGESDAGRPQNCVAIIYRGEIVATYIKHHLPNYGVFDEYRNFTPGNHSLVIRVCGVDIGIAICEDIWQSGGPVAELTKRSIGLLLVPNGSPYEINKNDARLALVQGRGDDGQVIINDAKALAAAGVFAIVLEAIPAQLAKQITTAISIPTIGIGAGVDCDGQVLVWTDLMGLTAKMPKLAKAYRNMRKEMSDAVSEFAEDVAAGRFPTAEQSFN